MSHKKILKPKKLFGYAAVYSDNSLSCVFIVLCYYVLLKFFAQVSPFCSAYAFCTLAPLCHALVYCCELHHSPEQMTFHSPVYKYMTGMTIKVCLTWCEENIKA